MNGDRMGGRHTSLEAYIAHNEAMREADLRFQEERDRRYSEVKAAEEKALKVKEQADRDALALSSKTQEYKDAKANELREQIGSERGLYATHQELAASFDKMVTLVRPAVDYAQGQQSGPKAITGPMVMAAIAFVLASIGGIVGIAATLLTILFAFRKGG